MWQELPQIAFWLLPGAIGAPHTHYALLRHPLIRAYDFRAPTKESIC